MKSKMYKRFFSLLMAMVLLIGVNCSNVYAYEEATDKEIEVIDVTQLMNSRATVSVMQIEGNDLSFDTSWEKHYYLHYSTDDVIVGEIVCGYNVNTNKVYCKAYSSLYSHKAKIIIANTPYYSGVASAFQWAQKNVTHSASENNSIHEFGIEMYDAYSGSEYYFQIVY